MKWREENLALKISTKKLVEIRICLRLFLGLEFATNITFSIIFDSEKKSSSSCVKIQRLLGQRFIFGLSNSPLFRAISQTNKKYTFKFLYIVKKGLSEDKFSLDNLYWNSSSICTNLKKENTISTQGIDNSCKL